MTASLSRSFAGCCDKLVSDYEYAEEDVEALRRDIHEYNKIKEMIKLASHDYIDLKPYEADMRYILDTYIRAEDSTVVSELGNMTIVELLLQGKTTTPADLIHDLPGDDEAKAETIENNLKHEIIKKRSSNTVRYNRLSEMLQELIKQRKIAALSYEEYLRQVVEMAEAIMHPEMDESYPESVRGSVARQEFFGFFGNNADLAVDVDDAIRTAMQPGWKNNFQKTRRIFLAICKKLVSNGYTDDEAEEKADQVMDIVQRQEEYNV